jgi:putative ABC transport system substrate-binding protein
LGIKLQALEVRTAGALDSAFAAIVREKPDALLILADRVFLHDRKRMMDFATEHRLPSTWYASLFPTPVGERSPA